LKVGGTVVLEKAELPGADDGLHPGAHAQRLQRLGEMVFDRPPRKAEDLADIDGEIAFAPKELKVAQDLSERLGAYTYKGRSQSRPTLLGKGSRSLTESDQRRPLMLPQELIQMPQDQLIVLRAGLPPVKGRKIVYWREKKLWGRC
jgi:hypothetical protein